MRLAVLLYGDTANEDGLPAAWPCQVLPLTEEAPAPQAPWIEMTEESLEQYRADHQAEYDAWVESLNPPQTPEQAAAARLLALDLNDPIPANDLPAVVADLVLVIKRSL